MTITDWFALIGCLTGVTSLGWNIFSQIEKKPKLQLSGHVTATTDKKTNEVYLELKLYVTNASDKVVIIGWVDFIMSDGSKTGAFSGYQNQLPMVLRPPEVGEITFHENTFPHPIKKIIVRDSLKNEYMLDDKVTSTIRTHLSSAGETVKLTNT